MARKKTPQVALKCILIAALVALKVSFLTGCYATVTIPDEPPAYAVAYDYPSDVGAVVVEPGVFYRIIVVDGEPRRFYYRWDGSGWAYHGHEWHGHAVVRETYNSRSGPSPHLGHH